MRAGACAAAALGVLAALFAEPALRRQQHEATGLAPFGGGVVKDLVAYALCSIPRLGRTFRAAPTPEALEGWHDGLQYSRGARLRDSPNFAENFYFWANSREDTSFLLSTRLAFWGANASNVFPWFHFELDGEAWDLPKDFEAKTLPHETGGAREAVAPGMGTLTFECEDPMRLWKLRYQGAVRSMRSGELRQVEAEFTCLMNPRNAFMYQLHWDELSAGRAMAAKAWTASFWENLRAQNQERYASLAEGILGTVQFKGREKVQLDALDGSRDHNFGIRNWRFMHTYIWFPPVKFAEPIVIGGVRYTYLTGAMTMYGNCFDNIVVGGLMSDNGDCAPWGGSTPMRQIAPEWFDASGRERFEEVGRETLKHGSFDWQLAILHGQYILDIHNDRGPERGMWQHSFFPPPGGAFEIHEALALWRFDLRATGSTEVLQTTTAVGLLEFGKNLVGYDESV